MNEHEDEKGYNGWTNYETWNVALWLGNDQGTEDDCLEMTAQARKDGHPRYALKESLKGYIADMMPDLGASMFADLLQSALDNVNWYEIADHYFEDYPAEDEGETE